MPITGTGTVLGQALWTAVKTSTSYTPPDAGAEAAGLATWTAFADALILHLVANSTVLVASVSGVTPGPGASGPGTGTIT